MRQPVSSGVWVTPGRWTLCSDSLLLKPRLGLPAPASAASTRAQLLLCAFFSWPLAQLVQAHSSQWDLVPCRPHAQVGESPYFSWMRWAPPYIAVHARQPFCHNIRGMLCSCWCSCQFPCLLESLHCSAAAVHTKRLWCRLMRPWMKATRQWWQRFLQ